MDGLDLCKELRILLPGLPIILLTALGTTDDKVEGFDAGADDYLVKPFEMRELVARVKALVNRSGAAALQTNKILKYCDLEMNLDTKLLLRSSREIKLTPKEFMLLQYLMENPERVLSKNEFAEKVWGIHFDPGTTAQVVCGFGYRFLFRISASRISALRSTLRRRRICCTERWI